MKKYLNVVKNMNNLATNCNIDSIAYDKNPRIMQVR